MGIRSFVGKRCVRRFVRLFGLPIVVFVLAVMALACSARLARTLQTSVFEVPLALIGGGLFSTFLIFLAEALKSNTRLKDTEHALAAELALNVVWARYNCNPLSDGSDTAWVPFRTDSLFAALKCRSVTSLPDPVWDTLVRTVDRMHSFNEDRATIQALIDVAGGGVKPVLREAMVKAASELYRYYLPLLVCDLPHTEPARVHYEADFPSAAQLDMCRSRRVAEMKGDGDPANDWDTFEHQLNARKTTTP